MAMVTAAAAVAATGCGDDRRFAAGAAEEVRELPLLDEVPVRKLTRDEFAAEAADNADGISDDYLQYYADTYGRVGFFDRTLDLRPVFAGSSSDWVGATYSPSRKLITLVGDAPVDTEVHEWVHALQDQHFGLLDYDNPDSSDSFLARRAVVEGDATLAQYRFVANDRYGTDLDGLDWAQAFEARRQFSGSTLVEADYPVVFLDYVSFVYTYGLELVAHNLTGATYDQPEPAPAPHDWSLEDALFTDAPPATTQEVLGLGEADPVIPIGLQEVPAAQADRLEALDWDSFGEWYSYLLLFPLDQLVAGDGGIDARALAAAWDGDRALFVKDLETGEVAVIWASIWDDETAAQAVVDALWQLYGRTPIDGQPDHVALGDDGEIAWVERRGNAVVAARNLPDDVAAALVDAAFAGPVSQAPRRRLSLPAAIDRRGRAGSNPGLLGGCPRVGKLGLTVRQNAKKAL
jgi:hypothetical protein